ncbi:NnrS family protein [Bowmanella pacifica]|uniref:Heme transporter CcmB n=1 Tax=Bowmanella pacifica TaxID=502051 RepID=A0A917YZE7_9ALTE|nr:NnrS family protein [Bowmanella pacifica]GGO70507.1 heme transporter CcmB [Bowmanella pacifica]
MTVSSPHELPAPLFRLGFRPMFLVAALFAIVAIGAWGGTFAGWWGLTPYGGSYFWHAHEMLFGFVAAVVTGFLLTAVQNWTGVPGVKGRPLALLVLVWAVGRVLMWWGPGWSPWLVASLDLLFLPMVAGFMAYPLIKVSQWRNLFFVPVLALMTLANFLTHLSVISGEAHWFKQGSYLMLMLVTLLMAVIGGRVIPMFTANGTGTTKVLPIAWLEKAALLCIWLLVLNVLFGNLLPANVLGLLCLLAGSLHLCRWWRWRVWLTLAVPLLWSLHMAYLFIPLGLLALAAHYLGDWLPLSTAAHLLTVGGMGGMIMAMMARVSLGHSGRPLQPRPIMSLAFALIFLAALVRTLGSWLLHQQILTVFVLASILWCLGFAIFTVVYWPVLTRPRVDGKPG